VQAREEVKVMKETKVKEEISVTVSTEEVSKLLLAVCYVSSVLLQF
jgi:hypothetical protein